MADIHGWTAKGFEAVRDRFAKNFDEGAEVGSAFAAYHRGEKVVDLWGGVADEDANTPWNEDTLIPVFSTTKGAAAICANQLAQQGRLDMDAPAANYWPEFAANGKEHIPVSYLLSHQAGLAWVDGEMTPEEALAWDPVIRALEKQTPLWEPGTQHGYHATTYGWLVGEVVKRIAGQSIGSYFAEHVAAPLDLSFWIGLPESEEHRVGKLISMIPKEAAAALRAGDTSNPLVELMQAFLGPDTPLGQALFAPGGALTDQDIWNTREMHAAEVPAANGITDARSLARMYAATIGEVDGVRLLTPEQLEAATTQQTSGPNYVLMGMDIQFGLGFMLHSSLIALGGQHSFGHFGAGGSAGWADPDADLAFGYVMNRMDLGVTGDLRSFNLINACYAAVS